MMDLRCDNIFPPKICPECGGSDFEFDQGSFLPDQVMMFGWFQCVGLADPGHPNKELLPCSYYYEIENENVDLSA